MANSLPFGKGSESINEAEHIEPSKTGDNIEAKRVANYVWDGSTNWVRMTQSGGGGGGAATVADGADVAEGATTDAAVTAGSAGTVSGKLRQISSDISSGNTAQATSANQTNGTQKTKLVTSAGAAFAERPDNYLKIATEPTSLFYDTFDAALDTTNRWTLTGTSPTSALGILTVSPNTTTLAFSSIYSQPAFQLLGNMYNEAVAIITTDSTLKTGNYRFYGFIAPTGSPTVALPMLDGVGYEWDATTGVLSGVVWSNSVRTQSLSLSTVQNASLLDGGNHRYNLYYKTSRVYFELDNVAVGSIAYPNPTISTMAVGLLSVNGASTVSPAAVFTSSFVGVGDTSANNSSMSDGTYPWRKAKIDTNGNQNSSIYDGTNVGNIVAGDAGFNGQIINNGVKTISYTTSIAGAQTLIANTDIRGYTWIEVYHTSVGVGLALTGQFSQSSGGTYTSSSSFGTGTGATNGGVGTNVSTLYYGPTKGNYFQLVLSALTSGTFSGTVTLRTIAPIATTLNTSVNAGTNLIGKVGIDQTTPGTTNATSTAQIGSATVLAGNGVTGTGAQRVTITSDNSAVAGFAVAATGAAKPVNAQLQGLDDGTNIVGAKDYVAQTAGSGIGIASVAIGGGLMPIGTKLIPTANHLTTNATTQVTASTGYISSIAISNEVGGTTSTITIQDGSGTPLKLVNGVATTALTTTPTVLTFNTPVLMTSGINIITAGAVAATVDVWINYYQ